MSGERSPARPSGGLIPRGVPIRSMNGRPSPAAGPAPTRDGAKGDEATPAGADEARSRRRDGVSIAAALVALLAVEPARAACADVGLVLAIDASGSVSPTEFQLQVQGYADALRHPAVLGAIRRAGVVDLAAVVWGDSRVSPRTLPWRRIAGPGDAAAAAAALETGFAPVGGDTGLGEGLWAALDLHEEVGRCARRAIVNVSGDGRESGGPQVRARRSVNAARARADRDGVIINGLAITTEDPQLDVYYRSTVATGPNAFVMTVDDLEDFAAAVARKLERELAPALLADAGQASR